MIRTIASKVPIVILRAALIGAMLTSPAFAEPKRPVIEQCAACHGEDGIARDAEVPHLAGQNEKYLFNQMMAFRAGKRPHKDMRYLARLMTVQEIAGIAAYYAALPPR